jgi:hypothetical protein
VNQISPSSQSATKRTRILLLLLLLLPPVASLLLQEWALLRLGLVVAKPTTMFLLGSLHLPPEPERE